VSISNLQILGSKHDTNYFNENCFSLLTFIQPRTYMERKCVCGGGEIEREREIREELSEQGKSWEFTVISSIKQTSSSK
jgi:hypothetical protein